MDIFEGRDAIMRLLENKHLDEIVEEAEEYQLLEDFEKIRPTKAEIEEWKKGMQWPDFNELEVI